MSLEISLDELKNIFPTLSIEYEVCGYLKSSNHYLNIYTENKGQKGECESRYRKYMWHTHPSVSKAYPSATDIIKVIKNEVIITSIIFTVWGIWEIHSVKKSPNLSLEKRQSMNKHINELSELVYLITDKGRIPTLSQEQLGEIYNYIAKMMRMFQGYKLGISLTLWKDIKDNYKLRFE